MRIPRKVVKFLRGLPDLVIILGIFAVWAILVIGLVYLAHYLAPFFIRGLSDVAIIVGSFIVWMMVLVGLIYGGQKIWEWIKNV